MYERALSLGITLISIAHRLQLRKYHNVELNLHGDGSGNFMHNTQQSYITLPGALIK